MSTPPRKPRQISGPKPIPLQWGAASAKARGPVIPFFNDPARNAIGGFVNGIQRAVAVAEGGLNPAYRANLHNTHPTFMFERSDRWKDIVSLDPFGHTVTEDFADLLKKGYRIQPTIGVTQAQLTIPEVQQAMADGTLKPDGKVLTWAGKIVVTKAYIDQVWHLPGVAKRLGVEEKHLRETLYKETGQYKDLIDRPDLDVFVPPIAGTSVYILGDPTKVGDPDVHHTVRIHDACHASDSWGSDICTCRPYFVYAALRCIESAQNGGIGILIYNHSTEGRAMGDVLKLLIYNARKRDPEGDTAERYFTHAENVAGIKDMRIYSLSTDPLLWLGVTRIHHLCSMSNYKFNALQQAGIEVIDRFEIPEEFIPADAQVEITAKKSDGYHTKAVPSDWELSATVGRSLTP
ncbi:MAG: GTP cyclohydrolase II [Candidatus Peribacteraceae bacterium]|nr:GTP cyclohydrolase II [Candidatus Peribacteraceae bacterium]